MLQAGIERARKALPRPIHGDIDGESILDAARRTLNDALNAPIGPKLRAAYDIGSAAQEAAKIAKDVGDAAAGGLRDLANDAFKELIVPAFIAYMLWKEFSK